MLDRWRLDCTEFNFCSHFLHESLGRTLWSPVWKGQNMKQEFVENQYNYTNLKDKFSFAIFLQYILLNKMFLHIDNIYIEKIQIQFICRQYCHFLICFSYPFYHHKELLPLCFIWTIDISFIFVFLSLFIHLKA